MNVVDSCGWLEYLSDGPDAASFAAAIEDVEQLVVPTISLYEVFKRVLQQRGEGAALQSVAQMLQGLVVPLDISLSISAASLSDAHHLPMADSIILATARAFRAALWTADAHFVNLEGVHYIAKSHQ